jgi:hypothetical protein
LELQHAEEARTRELQARLTTATSSVQQTLANLQASNANLQSANAQLEQQLRERIQELASLKATQASSDAREHLTAEVAVLKNELAQAKQTCEESLSLAQELQTTLEALLQNGAAQEESIALLQARIVKMELDRDELRAAQAAEAQRVREAVAEATAASEQPTTLEELQEQKIVQLLAQIGALEALLRERTEAITRTDQRSNQQAEVNAQAEAVQSQHRHLLRELDEIRRELRADSRRAVLMPELLARLDSLVTSEGKPLLASLPVASSINSPLTSSSPVTGQAPHVATPVLASPVVASAQMNGDVGEKTKKKGKKNSHDEHDAHGHSHGGDAHGHSHEGAHGHSHDKQPKRGGGLRQWLFGPRQQPAPAAK